jgi:hypothetical protein
MTEIQRAALMELRTDLYREREALEARLSRVVEKLALLDDFVGGPGAEATPLRTLPALTVPPAKDGAPYDPERPETVAAYLMAMGPGRLTFSASRPRPAWTDAEGVTRHLYLGGDAHNAHKAEGLGVPFGHGIWRGYWLTANEADRMGAIKRERAGTRKPSPPPPPVPAVEDDWRKGRHLVRDAAMVDKARDMGIGCNLGDVVWLTPMEDAQVRAHLRAGAA